MFEIQGLCAVWKIREFYVIIFWVRISIKNRNRILLGLYVFPYFNAKPFSINPSLQPSIYHLINSSVCLYIHASVRTFHPSISPWTHLSIFTFTLMSAWCKSRINILTTVKHTIKLCNLERRGTLEIWVQTSFHGTFLMNDAKPFFFPSLGSAEESRRSSGENRLRWRTLWKPPDDSAVCRPREDVVLTL